MPTVKLSPIFNGQTLAPGNAIASGYKLFTYAAGSSTKQATYTDNTGITAHTNPILIDANGYTTGGPIWLISGQNYKFILALPTDTDPPTTPIETFDYIAGVNDTVSGITQWIASGVAPIYISTTSFSLAGDQTGEFHVGRRLQLTTSSGTIYATIAASVFSAGITTVTLAIDSGVLDVGLSAVSYSILRADRLALPSNAMSIAGYMVKARMSIPVASATASFSADEISLESSLGGESYKIANFNKTINLAINGAGGMDVGPAPINGFVALYAILNPINNTQNILGVNATSAVAPNVYAGVNMPSGYIASALISVVATNASGQFKIGFQIGRSLGFQATSILTSGSVVSSYSILTNTTVIPLNAISVSGYCIVGNSTAATTSMAIASDANGCNEQFNQMSLGIANSQSMSIPNIDISTAQSIFYKTAASAGSPSYQILLSSYKF